MAAISLKGALVACLAGMTAALPSLPKLTRQQSKIHDIMKRQSAAEVALGLTDIDVLQFALTLENLEATFYQQGFAKFTQQDFSSLGLSAAQFADLTSIGASEQAHVSLLQSAIAQAGFQPVQVCTYNFDAAFASAAAMVQTAGILEQVGVSAYLGAAPILSSPSILSTAGSILTVEARHQSFIRAATGVAVAPNFFDTPLSPKQVFSLAAPFIASCPAGSNLILTAFPSITMGTVTPGAGAAAPSDNSAAAPAAGTAAASAGPKAGDTVQINLAKGGSSSAATFCAFTVGGTTGGSVFSPFVNGACVIPDGLTGFVFVNLASADPLTGVLSDDIIVAGPMPLQLS